MDDGRQARMHIGHIIDRDHGGTNERTNLRTLCSQCNQGAKNIVQEPPSYSWLLGRIRTASEADQMEILKWLSKKFQKKGTKTNLFPYEINNILINNTHINIRTLLKSGKEILL